MRSFVFILLSAQIVLAYANNLKITNPVLVDSQHIKCEISWENSWSLDTITPHNHDGIWLFLKAYDGTTWSHLKLSSNATDYSFSDSLSLTTYDDQVGIMLASNVNGAVDKTHVTIKLSEALDVIISDINIYGIEMVYIPEDSFYIGDSSSNYCFKTGNDGTPFLINSENEIPIGNNTNQLSDTGEYAPEDNLSADYPKGYNGFYIMKYEISQEQYVDFLNTLNYAQQAARTELPPNSAFGTRVMTLGTNTFRNGIVMMNKGLDNTRPAIYGCDGTEGGGQNKSDDGQNRACNYLGWDDVCAYLDWAGLSPMTELEYEKTTRGPSHPTSNEYAWGNTLIVDANELSDDGSANEKALLNSFSDSGTCNYRTENMGDSIQGPYRTGFAGHDSSSRAQIGAGYYGALELSGNLWELCITVNTEGLAFEGNHGDGVLDANGSANEIDWPEGTGAGHRGGAWNSGIDFAGFNDLAISDREYAGLNPTLRRNTTGGRGVRRFED